MTNFTRPRGHDRRRPSAQLIADGVVAAYIRDISGRHRRPDDAHERALVELRRSVHRRRDHAAITPHSGDRRAVTG